VDITFLIVIYITLKQLSLHDLRNTNLHKCQYTIYANNEIKEAFLEPGFRVDKLSLFGTKASSPTPHQEAKCMCI